MWVLLITAFQCWAVTSPCKISCLHFICTQADLLSQRKHCISGTNVSLPSAVSQAWKRMNTNINLLSVHPRFILICPLCSPVIPSCPLSFHLLFTQPSHHSRIHSSSGYRKRLVGLIAGQGWSFTRRCFATPLWGRTRGALHLGGQAE